LGLQCTFFGRHVKVFVIPIGFVGTTNGKLDVPIEIIINSYFLQQIRIKIASTNISPSWMTKDAVVIYDPQKKPLLTGWREPTGLRLWRINLQPDAAALPSLPPALSNLYNILRN
jgi:hypothetical protein